MIPGTDAKSGKITRLRLVASGQTVFQNQTPDYEDLRRAGGL